MVPGPEKNEVNATIYIFKVQDPKKISGWYDKLDIRLQIDCDAKWLPPNFRHLLWLFPKTIFGNEVGLFPLTFGILPPTLTTNQIKVSILFHQWKKVTRRNQNPDCTVLWQKQVIVSEAEGKLLYGNKRGEIIVHSVSHNFIAPSKEVCREMALGKVGYLNLLTVRAPL